MNRLKEEHKPMRMREDLCSESTSIRPEAIYRVGTPDETPHDKEREERQDAMWITKPQEGVL